MKMLTSLQFIGYGQKFNGTATEPSAEWALSLKFLKMSVYLSRVEFDAGVNVPYLKVGGLYLGIKLCQFGCTI